MTCDLCGSPTPRSTYCKECSRLQERDTVQDGARSVDVSEYECTSCGSLYVTDGSDACPECGARRRRFAGEVLADGGRSC